MDLCSEDARDETLVYGSRRGFWRFTVMHFGLCNAPAMFERLMERTLGQLQWQICLCYLYDTLIFSRTVDQYLYHLHSFQVTQRGKVEVKAQNVPLFPETWSILITL